MAYKAKNTGRGASRTGDKVKRTRVVKEPREFRQDFEDSNKGGFDDEPKAKRNFGKKSPRRFGDKPMAKSIEFTEDSERGSGDERKSFSKKPFGKPREFGDRSERGSGDERKSFSKKPFGKPREFGDRSERGSGDERKSFSKKPFGKPREFGDRSERGSGDERKSFSKKPFGKPREFGDRSERGSGDERKSFSKKPFGKPREFGDRSERGSGDERKSFSKKPFGKPREFGDRSERGSGDERKSFSKKPFSKSKSYRDKDKEETDPNRPAFKSYGKNPYKKSKEEKPESEFTRLNRLISNSGICSRREADEMIVAGLISVNGEIVTTLGTKVKRTDDVRYNGEPVRKEKLRYILLNKPKDYITTTDDPQHRHTVMELIEGACRERVYPVGRLDRNTTGLLLFTNDGELADKLMHPRCEVRKIYQVELDKNLKQDDLEKISKGIELEDGKVSVDEIAYGSTDDGKRVVGVTLHSGRNRIVRRIFEHLGYDVKKLDRVYYAGLTKKDLTRGRWRHLDEMELNMLKMIRKP